MCHDAARGLERSRAGAEPAGKAGREAAPRGSSRCPQAECSRFPGHTAGTQGGPGVLQRLAVGGPSGRGRLVQRREAAPGPELRGQGACEAEEKTHFVEAVVKLGSSSE